MGESLAVAGSGAGRGQEPRRVSSLSELKKSREWILPRASRGEGSPANTVMCSPVT